MAADYIVVAKTNRPQLGAQLVNLANRLREVRDLCDALNDIGQHQFNGADFSLFEAQFGLTAGTGANTLTLLGLINTILNTSGTVAGVDRLSQLDEFVSRLAGQ
jgi:hypothetical protein